MDGFITTPEYQLSFIVGSKVHLSARTIIPHTSNFAIDLFVGSASFSKFVANFDSRLLAVVPVIFQAIDHPSSVDKTTV